MGTYSGLFSSIIILLLIVAFAIVFMTRKNKRTTDYRILFFLGIIFIGAGVPLKIFLLTLLGILYMAIGIAHRKDWGKEPQKWNELSKKEKTTRLVIIGIASLIFLGGLVIYILDNIGIIK